MSDEPVDKDALYDLVDQDPEFLESLVDTFIADCARYMSAIQTAVEEEDALTLREEAHGLKGAVANLQAASTEEAARRVEEAGRASNFDEAQAALEDLEEEVDRLQSVLLDMVQEMQE